MFSKIKGKLENNGLADAAGGAQKPHQKPVSPSIISPDLRIVGDVSSDGEVQVDGSIEGDVRAEVLRVGQAAVIKGEISANKVHIHGTVQGQIKAREVWLAKGSHVTGDVVHEELAIEAGASLEGMCKRLPKKELAENKLEPKINIASTDPARERIRNLGIGINTESPANNPSSKDNP